jgi:hypothetical protein
MVRQLQIDWEGSGYLDWEIFRFLADRLGIGSVQDSQKAEYEGEDEPFWDSVTANIKNLRAIISGHG